MICLPTQTPLTMSSREIAELTGKRHDHVIRDIEKMFLELELDAPKFGGIYKDAANREKPLYNLPKDLTLTLVSGYNVKLRNAIINRWIALEAQAHPQIPQTLPEALRLAADLSEQNAQLLPKANAYDVVAEHADDIGIRDCGRLLKIGQTAVANILISRRWACRDSEGRRKLKPAHYGLMQGYTRLVTRTYTTNEGETRLSDELRITSRGRARLAKIVSGEAGYE
ncbi:DNA-binding protein [Saccharibacter sp. 17.LH.SD]|uniref:Rha family transcriptional regulator n=1 Tax=Saccharibacter sp. 17.LH.SD TaxID=2689393 RepID=UPI001369D78C|nr:phage regulatory protein/antirepressor Ant [Saccharibacter sp. 17.LH.SD]MXV43494.1 DNA-binding protein [Saccharibacter sp. 17.LH.SD]